jgi:hydroxypyruvate reductase
MIELPRFDDHKKHLQQISLHALDAADAHRAVREHLHLSSEGIEAGIHTIGLKPGARIYLVAFGKAAPAMTRAAVEILQDQIVAGIIAAPHHIDDLPPSLQIFRAGHPLPDAGSLAAGRAAELLLESATADDLLLALVSGGGSAMLELPLPGIELDDLRLLNTLLIQSGLPIHEINTTRRALSRIKNGGLARLAAPARVVSLILSDVVGDRLSAIASGPTVLKRASRAEARHILQESGLWSETCASIRSALDLPDPPLEKARRPMNILIGTNSRVVHAAGQHAQALGFSVKTVTTKMQGEASEIGARFGLQIKNLRERGSIEKPVCLLMGGETTVTVRGQGLGGRNQELALAAAIALADTQGIAVMSFATDGIDGPTDAAGAIVTGDTAARARSFGFVPQEALQENDAYPLLKAAGALLHTGPTGTNLNDLVVGLIY